MEKNVVHVVGTGTIGEPLIGLMASFREKLGIDEITFHKRTPLVTDRSKVAALSRHGVKLAVDKDCWQRFKELDMEPCYEAEQAIERAKVVIDCTPVGNERKLAVLGSCFFSENLVISLSLTRRQYQIVKNFLRPVIFSALSL